MTKNNFCQLWLSVGNQDEADKIAKVLLNKHLVACVRQVSVSSNFWWHGKIDHADELLLQMESRADLFDQIETEVAKLHSYSTFVLEATAVDKLSRSAAKWLKSELKNG